MRAKGVCFERICWLGFFFLFAAQSGLGQAASSATSSETFAAAGIGTGSRAIGGLWQFHTGDDPAWAQPGFDDSAWERIPADSPWGDNGHSGYTGFAWYRRQIALDPTDKSNLALLLPPLDSVAEVYWNGVKMGGLGTPPPDAAWYSIPRPVAVPLPTTAGETTGTLAIRLWMRPLFSDDAPDEGGFRAAPLVGYAPLIQQKAEGWVEHRFRVRAISNAASLIYLLVAVGAFILWLRQRSRWIFLALSLYFLFYLLAILRLLMFGFHFVFETALNELTSYLSLAMLLMMLLLLFGLERNRFWLRFTLVMAGITVLDAILATWEVLVILTHPRLFHLLDVAKELLDYPLALVPLALLAAGLSTRKPRLPQVLFAVAAALDVLIQLLDELLQQNFNRMDALLAFIQRPLMRIYGSYLTVFATTKLLLLLAMLYAVWDHASQQIARRRHIDAEFKSAQEVQQVLVPAAIAEDAHGYAVASVYRPASEVGGDFFQVIPLPDRSTLIVAGDVSGKGLRAAMTVSLVVGAVRSLAEHDASPAAVLAGLNRRLMGRTQGGFATCCAVLVNPDGNAVMANAGHCQPYIDGHEIDLPAGLPLGLTLDAAYEEQSTTLAPGSRMVLVSDGVVEARNEKGELYGFDRVLKLIERRLTAEQIADTAIAFGQDDDITVLTLVRLARV